MMSEFVLDFAQPVSTMQFFCAGNTLDFAVEQINSVSVEHVAQPEAISHELADSIKRQLSEIGNQLAATKPRIKSIALEFANEFVALLFDNDQELIREKILANLNSAIEEFSPDGVTELFVHPDLVVEFQESFQEHNISGVKIVGDSLLAKSDCRIEGPEQKFIARLQTHLEIAKENALAKLNDTQVTG